MHWSIILALALAGVAVVASVTFSILEISRKLKRVKEQRTVLARLRAQQERKHLERVRAYLDLGADQDHHQQSAA
jgi:heme exporter protein D